MGTRLNPRKRQTGNVYFLQRDDTKLIKIGWTYWVRLRRLKLISETGVYLQLLGYMRGGTKLEAAIHREFAKYRVVGEWFTPVPDLLDFIAIFTTTAHHKLEARSQTEIDESIRKAVEMFRDKP